MGSSPAVTTSTSSTTTVSQSLSFTKSSTAVTISQASPTIKTTSSSSHHTEILCSDTSRSEEHTSQGGKESLEKCSKKDVVKNKSKDFEDITSDPEFYEKDEKKRNL